MLVFGVQQYSHERTYRLGVCGKTAIQYRCDLPVPCLRIFEEAPCQHSGHFMHQSVLASEVPSDQALVDPGCLRDRSRRDSLNTVPCDERGCRFDEDLRHRLFAVRSRGRSFFRLVCHLAIERIAQREAVSPAPPLLRRPAAVGRKDCAVDVHGVVAEQKGDGRGQRLRLDGFGRRRNG